MENRFIGIVVKQIHPSRYYVWCKNCFPGTNGYLETNPKHPVKIGDWIEMYFTLRDANRYFPERKRRQTARFHCDNYKVIQDVLETRVHSNFIRIRLEQKLIENQHSFDHPVLGKVSCNSERLQFPTGSHHLIIKRKFLNERTIDSCVWEIEPETEVIGVVAGKDPLYFFVTCKERPPGKDVVIEKIPGNQDWTIGTWVKMILPADEMNSNLRCYEYSVIPVVLHTELIGDVGKKTLQLKLMCETDENGDIYDPVIGPINLEMPDPLSMRGFNRRIEKLEKSRKYAIAVHRERPDKNEEVPSVWYLSYYELLEDDSLLQLQNTDGLATHNHLLSLHPFLKKAIVVKIENNPDKTFVWLFNKKKEARVYFEVDNPQLGEVLIAPFTDKDQKWSSWGPPFLIADESYETRAIESGVADILVEAENLQTPDNKHSYIYHNDFGDIIDNKSNLKKNETDKYRMWIRRVGKDDERRWVVVEEVH